MRDDRSRRVYGVAEGGPHLGMAWATLRHRRTRPGVVAYLATAGITAGSLRTSLDLELALLELNPSHDEPESEPQPNSNPNTSRTTLARFDIQAEADLHVAVANVQFNKRLAASFGTAEVAMIATVTSELGATSSNTAAAGVTCW